MIAKLNEIFAPAAKVVATINTYLTDYVLLFLLIGIGLFSVFGESLLMLYMQGEQGVTDAAQTLHYAKEYMSIMLIGLIPFTAVQCYAGTLRESANPTPPMVAGVIAAVAGIAVIVLGGTLVGIALVVLGVVILRIIFIALTMLGVSSSSLYIIKGAIILCAVALDMRKYLVKK